MRPHSKAQHTTFVGAGVNGYEYLDKIIQVPFSIPLLANSEMRALTEGYLKAGGAYVKPDEAEVSNPKP